MWFTSYVSLTRGNKTSEPLSALLEASRLEIGQYRRSNYQFSASRTSECLCRSPPSNWSDFYFVRLLQKLFGTCSHKQDDTLHRFRSGSAPVLRRRCSVQFVRVLVTARDVVDSNGLVVVDPWRSEVNTETARENNRQRGMKSDYRRIMCFSKEAKKYLVRKWSPFEPLSSKLHITIIIKLCTVICVTARYQQAITF